MPFGDTGFWALLGMTAILGGTMRAPLTATLFAVELTGNSHLLPQLFVASVAGFGFTVLVMRRSILTERIARRGLHLTREYGVDPFDVMRVGDIMARPVDTLPAAMPVNSSGEILRRWRTAQKLSGGETNGRSARWYRGGRAALDPRRLDQRETLGDLEHEMVTASPTN